MNQCDALKVGDMVTVLECIDRPSDHSFHGQVLRVEAIDAPFVAFTSNGICTKLTLDTRRFALMRLSPEYVAAAQG